MEALLSLAFDNLSSYDGLKINKGLKQVEGLLAQICLSSPAGASKSPRKPSSSPTKDGDSPPSPHKALSDLSDDPAFREFFKLQQGFEWNVAQRLLTTLDRLVARGGDGQNDLLILNALDLIQGVLLLHPPSKALFSREVYMDLLLDLVEPVNCPAIQCATLLTLVVALIGAPRNTRTFESQDGLLTITSLFRSRSTSRDVKLKLVEFLYFYLMPETPSIPRAEARANSATPAMLQRSPSKLARAFAGDVGSPAAARRRRADSGDDDDDDGSTRTTEEKQAFLAQHLPTVEDLVKDLRNSAPFGGVVV
ncbi:cell division control protein 14 [Phialemonium atrogriseum]|uniref:Cell division control protein 14 n=1 Tax=Phialemonium atrogriseum TaxID=1093897 RepID=A0AAJ0C7C5_9PEZI|nr:cell division control protein 14 [Phialemonium atrogriseum]KAK1770867.1 cell division control protein 14 [Phialemonium atrogriseum]